MLSALFMTPAFLKDNILIMLFYYSIFEFLAYKHLAELLNNNATKLFHYKYLIK
jgi:hypothetical protein